MLLCGRGGWCCFALLNGGMGTESSEEVGEERALGWHCVVVHEGWVRQRSLGRKKESRGNKKSTESSDCKVDTLREETYIWFDPRCKIFQGIWTLQ
jgi:hypothetical protein